MITILDVINAHALVGYTVLLRSMDHDPVSVGVVGGVTLWASDQ